MSTNIKVSCVKCDHVNEYRPVDFEKIVIKSTLTKEAFLAQFLCRSCRSASGVKAVKVAKVGKIKIDKQLSKAQRHEAEWAREALEKAEKVGYLSVKEEAEVISKAVHESDISVSVRPVMKVDMSKMENISSLSDLTSGDIIFDTVNPRYFEVTTIEDGIVVGHELGVRESVNVNFTNDWLRVKEQFVQEIV